MPNNGQLWERRAMRLLEVHGYIVMRSAASAGPVDLIAWNSTERLNIQVKRARSRHVLSDAKRMALREFRSAPWLPDDLVQLWVYGPENSWLRWDYILDDHCLLAKPWQFAESEVS